MVLVGLRNGWTVRIDLEELNVRLVFYGRWKIQKGVQIIQLSRACCFETNFFSGKKSRTFVMNFAFFKLPKGPF